MGSEEAVMIVEFVLLVLICIFVNMDVFFYAFSEHIGG